MPSQRRGVGGLVGLDDWGELNGHGDNLAAVISPWEPPCPTLLGRIRKPGHPRGRPARGPTDTGRRMSTVESRAGSLGFGQAGRRLRKARATRESRPGYPNPVARTSNTA
ncbi:hypothetical protein Atai01_27790 [Amycolatopsis taiwanensis]|uniref:Uncharacterized protein n=1 Tax=Amycolatopsis taiwanensis TaxID=342230 RepID=A0A9W6R259_9PSEU|nr:hypothetical protein Atai01_27790 [Amycolatopsis taiwanensis]